MKNARVLEKIQKIKFRKSRYVLYKYCTFTAYYIYHSVLCSIAYIYFKVRKFLLNVSALSHYKSLSKRSFYISVNTLQGLNRIRRNAANVDFALLNQTDLKNA